MKVTVLGSGGSAVSSKRACPSFLVDDSILFDLGPGSLRSLRISRIPLEKLSKVFISHTHADHVSDLVPFLWAAQIDGRQSPLELFGPPGFKEVFQQSLKCTSTKDDFFKFPLTVSEIGFGDRVDNVSTCRTAHAIPTLAFRVDLNRKSFCYSADTAYCTALVELAQGVDLLIHEATFLRDQLPIAELTGHSTGEMAGRAAREAHAKGLVLFHIPPPNESRENEIRTEAESAYGKQVVVSTDLVSFEI
jgi:ribonuclease BN (tRNA processing enzyme)